MVSEKESTVIYIDGILNKIVPDFTLLPIDNELSGRMILGNAPDGTHAWNGSFFSLAVYNQAVRKAEVLEHYQGDFGGPAMPAALYLFNEHSGELIHDYSGSGHDLMIPPVFQPLRRTVLGMTDKGFFFSRSNLNDIAINIVGFMPFGFLVSAWLRLSKNLSAPRVYGISLFFGFCLSLAIELIQIYLPARDSSLMDVISNTMGTVAGILIFKHAFPVPRNIHDDSALL
jgi:hypothetical protein